MNNIKEILNEFYSQYNKDVFNEKFLRMLQDDFEDSLNALAKFIEKQFSGKKLDIPFESFCLDLVDDLMANKIKMIQRHGKMLFSAFEESQKEKK